MGYLDLHAVQNELLTTASLLPKTAYLGSTQPIYRNTTWLSSISFPRPIDLARRVLQSIGLARTEVSSEIPTGEYVIIRNVEEASRRILSAVEHAGNRVYSLETFIEDFAGLLTEPAAEQKGGDTRSLGRRDSHILLTHLTRDLHAAAITPSLSTLETDTSENVVIKFTVPLRPSTKPEPITQSDITTAQLNTLSRRLSNQINTLTHKHSELDNRIRAVVSSTTKFQDELRTRALPLLKQRNALSATLEKRNASLAQVEGALNAIEEAAGNVEVVRALEGSAKVVKGLNEQVGGIDGVEAVMDGLEEETAVAGEIGGIIHGGVQGADEDDEKVEEELRALEGQAAAREEEAPRLPDVPSGPVGVEGGVAGKEANVDDVGEKLGKINLGNGPARLEEDVTKQAES